MKRINYAGFKNTQFWEEIFMTPSFQQRSLSRTLSWHLATPRKRSTRRWAISLVTQILKCLPHTRDTPQMKQRIQMTLTAQTTGTILTGTSGPRRGSWASRRGSSASRRGSSAPRRGSWASRRGSSAPRRGSWASRRGSSAPRRGSSASRRGMSGPRIGTSASRRGLTASSSGFRGGDSSVHKTVSL